MRARVVLPVIAAAVLTVAGGLVLRRDDGGPAVPSEPPAVMYVVPTVPPDADDARAFAANWVSGTGPLLAMGPIERRAVLERQVVPESLESMLSAVESDLFEARDALPIPASELLVTEVPITVDAAVDGETATARVWSVVVFGAETLGSPRCLWRVSDLELRAIDGEWRVAAVKDTEGPSPMGVDSLPASWAEFATVASWSPAPAGGER